MPKLFRGRRKKTLKPTEPGSEMTNPWSGLGFAYLAGCSFTQTRVAWPDNAPAPEPDTQVFYDKETHTLGRGDLWQVVRIVQVEMRRATPWLEVTLELVEEPPLDGDRLHDVLQSMEQIAEETSE